MNKHLFFCLFLLCALFVWPEEETDIDKQLTEEIEHITGRLEENEKNLDISHDENEEKVIIPAKPGKEEKIPLRLKNRGFEIALLRTNAGFSNSFIAAKDFFQETAYISLEDLTRGFNAEFDLQLAPVAFNFNIKDKWGFGFDLANVSAFGNIEISKNLLQLQQTEMDKFGAGGAVFLDFGLPFFFHIRKIKLKFRPAAYLPVVYTEPGITYTFTKKGNGLFIGINYDMYIYSPLSLESIIDTGSFDYEELLGLINTTTLGFDMNAGFEFPLAPWLNVGIDLLNIPLKPSLVNHYMRMTGEAFLDTSDFDMSDIINGVIPDNFFDYPSDFSLEYGTGEKTILRPFKFIAHAVYYPFKSPVFSLIPNLGLSVNSIFAQPASIEAGLKVRLDLANMFITTIGVNYEDCVWRNSVNFVINLRSIELDIGVAVGSQDFVKSWQGAGASVNIGLKLGW